MRRKQSHLAGIALLVTLAGCHAPTGNAAHQEDAASSVTVQSLHADPPQWNGKKIQMTAFVVNSAADANGRAWKLVDDLNAYNAHWDSVSSGGSTGAFGKDDRPVPPQPPTVLVMPVLPEHKYGAQARVEGVSDGEKNVIHASKVEYAQTK